MSEQMNWRQCKREASMGILCAGKWSLVINSDSLYLRQHWLWLAQSIQNSLRYLDVMDVHWGSGLFILFMQVKGCIQITVNLEWSSFVGTLQYFSAPRFTQICFHTQRACASMLSKPVSWCGHERQCGASFSNELIQTRTRDSFIELWARGGW